MKNTENKIDNKSNSSNKKLFKGDGLKAQKKVLNIINNNLLMKILGSDFCVFYYFTFFYLLFPNRIILECYSSYDAERIHVKNLINISIVILLLIILAIKIVIEYFKHKFKAEEILEKKLLLDEENLIYSFKNQESISGKSEPVLINTKYIIPYESIISVKYNKFYQEIMILANEVTLQTGEDDNNLNEQYFDNYELKIRNTFKENNISELLVDTINKKKIMDTVSMKFIRGEFDYLYKFNYSDWGILFLICIYVICVIISSISR